MPCRHGRGFRTEAKPRSHDNLELFGIGWKSRQEIPPLQKIIDELPVFFGLVRQGRGVGRAQSHSQRALAFAFRRGQYDPFRGRHAGVIRKAGQQIWFRPIRILVPVWQILR